MVQAAKQGKDNYGYEDKTETGGAKYQGGQLHSHTADQSEVRGSGLRPR